MRERCDRSWQSESDVSGRGAIRKGGGDGGGGETNKQSLKFEKGEFFLFCFVSRVEFEGKRVIVGVRCFWGNY